MQTVLSQTRWSQNPDFIKKLSERKAAFITISSPETPSLHAVYLSPLECGFHIAVHVGWLYLKICLEIKFLELQIM